MFALIRRGRPNILFGAKLRKTAQYPAQSSFCPAQLKGRGQERPLDFLAIFKVLKNS